MAEKSRGKRKRSYQPPRVVRYGNLKRLTGTKGGPNPDGTLKPNTYYGGALG